MNIEESLEIFFLYFEEYDGDMKKVMGNTQPNQRIVIRIHRYFCYIQYGKDNYVQNGREEVGTCNQS